MMINIRNILFLAMGSTAALFGLPQGLEVVSGAGQMDSSSLNQAVIYASDKAILKFDSFNVDMKERVTFQQPSSSATVLAKISGASSRILGTVNANGNLFLVNPDGIFFGPDANINAGSFIASTLDIRDEDFLADRLHFFSKGNKGQIANMGKIRINDFAALFSSSVTNGGTIVAAEGNVYIGAGEKVTLDFAGDGLMSFAVEGEIEKALIENKGKIYALNGNVELTLKAVRKAIQTVVNDNGVRLATTMIESNGAIQLVAKSEIKASKVVVDGDGKQTIAGSVAAPVIHLLADHIIFNGATIFASGPIPGEVLIGGDFGQGRVREAYSFFMNDHSSVYADAKGAGDGGKICIWSKGITTINGNLYARGGAISGDGGLVQTVGKTNLKIGKGYVTTWAPHGKSGEWLTQWKPE